MTRRSIERRERRPRLLHYDPYGKPKGSVSLEGAPIGSYEPSYGVFTELTVTGDIDVTGLVDGVDISNHAADVNAHHHTVVAGDTSIDVQAGQAVSVALAEVSGLDVDDGLQVADSIAGAGLTIASKVLAAKLQTPSGMLVGASGLALKTPSQVDATTSNEVSDVSGHTHAVGTAMPAFTFSTDAAVGTAAGLVRADATLALFDATAPSTLSSSSVAATGSAGKAPRRDHVHGITAYSDMSAYKGHLAKSDAEGRGKWVSLTATEYLRTSLLDSEAATGLTIAPALDLYLSPGDTKRVRATSAVRLQADNYVSQTTGWAIGYNGAADFRYIYTDELHAKAFIADLEQALAGGQIISKSVAPLSRDFTAPAAGAAAYLWVECFEGFPDQQVFQADDVVMLRNFSRAAGSLSITNCFGTVTAPYFPDPQSEPPEQRWTFTRLTGTVNGQPAAGTMAESAVVKRGALALDFGVTGAGYHEVNAIDGAMGEYSPYAQNVFWTAHPWYDRTVATRDGNLRGIFNVAGEYGLYAGDGTAAANQFVRISNEAIEAHNLPVHLYDGADITIALEPGSGTPSIAIGDPLPTGWLTQPGWWAGKDGAAYKQYVGFVSGGDLVRGAMWDGTNYHVRGNLIVGPGTGFVVEDALLHCPFDGARPYETAFDVELSGHLGQAPIAATGGLIGRPGKFGKAVQLAEATTNNIGNPLCKPSGWWGLYFYGGGTGGLTYVSDSTCLGGYRMRASYENNGNNTQLRGEQPQIQANTAYAFSCRIRAYKALSMSFVVCRGSSPYTTYLYYTVDVGTEWTEVRGLATTPADTTNGIVYFFRLNDPGATGWVDVDWVQLEAKPYHTPVAEGSMGPGHSWAGTPYWSASTRAAPILTYASAGNFPAADGTVSVWVKREVLSRICTMVRLDCGDAEYFMLRVLTGGVECCWGQPIDSAYAPITQDRNWHHIVGTREGNTIWLYYDGVLRASYTATWSNPDGPILIGRDTGDVRYLNGYIDDLLIVDRAMSADEVLALYESGKPVTVTTSPMSLLLTGSGRGKVEGNASGLYGWDAGGAAAWALATEAKTFGGANLGAGDVFVGNVAQGQYLHWDDSAGKLTVRGDVAVSGSVSVAWQDITNPPDGAGRLGTGAPGAKGLWLTGSHVGYYNGSFWPVDIGNDGTFYFSKDANNYVKYDGTTFEVKGRIVVTEGTTVDSLPDGTTYGKVNKTIISGGNIRVGTGTKDSNLNGWAIDSTEIVGQAGDGKDQVVLGTDGKIKAGAGLTTIGRSGITLQAETLEQGGTNPGTIPGSRITFKHEGYYIGLLTADWPEGVAVYSLRLMVGSTFYEEYTSLSLSYEHGSPSTKSVSTNGSLQVSGLLSTFNSGARIGYSATMKPGDGELHVVKSIGVGIDYTPGTGNVDASGYVRGQKGLVLGDGVAAPTAASGIAFIYVDSADGDLKVKFGDGTTKTLATDT